MLQAVAPPHCTTVDRVIMGEHSLSIASAEISDRAYSDSTASCSPFLTWEAWPPMLLVPKPFHCRAL